MVTKAVGAPALQWHRIRQQVVAAATAENHKLSWQEPTTNTVSSATEASAPVAQALFFYFKQENVL